MIRAVNKADTNVYNRRAYFDVRLLDGITPAVTEAGGQSQISINGSGWTSVGIGLLVDIGFGSYYADLDQTTINIANPGDIIETRYKGPLTADTRGDTFQITGTILPVIPPTVLAFDALSYIDVNTADVYFNNRLHSEIWIDTDDQTKLIALRDSTRRIDRLNFAGQKTNESQLLQFPRKSVPVVTQVGFGFTSVLPDSDNLEEIEPDNETEVSLHIDTEIPADIQIACCEIAIALLDGRDPDLDIENLAVDSQSQSGIRTGYSRKYALEHVRSGIPSALAWSYLRPYLRDFRNMVIRRA